MQSIYLDNAATSFPKPAGVSDSMKRYLDCVGATINRSVYGRAQEAGLETLALRESLARLFRFPEPATHVVLTPGATFGLNLVIKGLLRPGDHCIVSGMEHNAVMRPLQQLGAWNLTAFPATARAFCSMARSRACSGPTRALLCWRMRPTSAAVCRMRPPSGRPARGTDAFSCWTARRRQDTIPSTLRRSAFRRWPCRGTRAWLGPSGIGALLLTDELAANLTPLVAGGTGSASDSELLPPYLPDRLESGTPNLPGIYGLRAALAFVEQQGVERLRRHELALCERFLDGIAPLSGVRLCGTRELGRRVGVISVDLPGRDNAEAAFRHEQEFGHPDALRPALRPCGAPFPRDVPAGDHPLLARLCEHRAGRRRRRCSPAGNQRRLILGPPL